MSYRIRLKLAHYSIPPEKRGDVYEALVDGQWTIWSHEDELDFHENPGRDVMLEHEDMIDVGALVAAIWKAAGRYVPILCSVDHIVPYATDVEYGKAAYDALARGQG